ncbi:hypothetical protein AwMethylo_42050 [Methylobacterium sp.]|nr:hypothetical protein AwMethylo_42050 [Methylobacterium sp.]
MPVACGTEWGITPIEIMLFFGGVWLWHRWAAHLRVEEREAERARIQGELRLGYPRQ